MTEDSIDHQRSAERDATAQAVLDDLAVPLEGLQERLGSGPDGLSGKEAEERLKRFGPNSFPERKKSVLKNLLVQVRNLFNVLLVIAAALSFTIGLTTGDQASVEMGVVILLVVLVSVIFSLLQERHAEKVVEAISDLVPMNARVMRDGQVNEVQVAKIVPGDVILFEEGDRVPADARVIDCYELSVDNSTLTGESEPQPRTTGIRSGTHDDLARCPNLVLAGTTIASGSGKGLVMATGTNTEFGRVVTMAQSIEEPPSPLQREINRTARFNFVVAIGVGLVFLMIAYLGLHLAIVDSLLFMIGVMISLVPEGFQITLTLGLALSSVTMSRRHVVVKRLSSVETLGSTTVICTDKTGTITEGQMTVKRVWIGGVHYHVTGEGYEPEGSIMLDDRIVRSGDSPQLRRLCEVSALDNNATIVPPLDRRKSRWTAIGDPTEAALLVLAAKSGIAYKEEIKRQPRIGLIPFESSRKMMTSVHQCPDGETVAYVKGAGAEVLSRCTSAYWDGSTVPLSPDIEDKVRQQIDAFAREAYRVLAIAFRDLPGKQERYESISVEEGLTFVGLVAILDPPRAETPEAVHKARTAGIRVVMLTGDHELTAESIARKVGIISTKNSRVTTGYQLERMSDEQLSELLDVPELVFARVTPAQKLRIVRLFRAKGETVAVTGDGVNDAPALLEADIGIAMGLSGTDVARESADMILLDDNFASIVNGVEVGRSVFDNLKKFVVYVFTHNWAELLAFIVFVLLRTPLPLAVVGVLAIDLIMEIAPSLALMLEPPEPGIMENPPRSKKVRLFSLSALTRSAFIGLITGGYALFWCFSAWSQGGWGLGSGTVPDHGAYLAGLTVVIVGIMAGQFGMLFATRTNVRSALSISIARNKWILRAVAVEIGLLLAIVYLPFLQTAFMTVTISPLYFLVLYAIAPTVLLVEETRKLLLRRVYLPTRPIAPYVAPAPSLTVGASSEAAIAGAFVERSPPIILPLSMAHVDIDAVQMSTAICRHLGSRLIVMRLMDEGTEDWMVRKAEVQVERSTSTYDLPVSYVDVEQARKEHLPRGLLSALNDLVAEEMPELLVIPVDHDVLAGRRRAIRRMRWMDRFSANNIVLVDSSPRTEARPIASRPRILIPILTEFPVGPFKLTEALTSNQIFPDVDVIAAKIVEMPRIVPLYSIYKPESLISQEQEFSVFKALGAGPLLKYIHPMVLLVRERGRDVLKFARDKEADLLILQGDWDLRRRGFLPKVERRIATRSPCINLVTLFPDAQRKNI